MSECIFCKIINGEIPADIVYKSENIIGFRDINPAAPTHILFVPKKHYTTLSDVPANDINVYTEIIEAIREVAKNEGIEESGYRVVTNVNKNAGQIVFHLHVHLIGGQKLGKMA